MTPDYAGWFLVASMVFATSILVALLTMLHTPWIIMVAPVGAMATLTIWITIEVLR